MRFDQVSGNTKKFKGSPLKPSLVMSSSRKNLPLFTSHTVLQGLGRVVFFVLSFILIQVWLPVMRFFISMNSKRIFPGNQYERASKMTTQPIQFA